ncbi:MAG TPA: hypothetical protein VHW00_03335 [Thermoanaerobaculia bacterium]|nr:hypothetical protein [Thermoanaerobaculia bacterium]
MTDWTQRRFSSSPMLELKRLDELPSSQQLAFADLAADADFYGLLVPRNPAESVKSVSRQTAELFHSLAHPHAIEFPDDAWRNDVIDLVLDGILEIEDDDRFVSGSDAYPLFFGAPPPAGDGLSLDALRHAEELVTRDVATMTTALYTYNRLPRTRAWAARFPGREAVLEHLGANPLLERHWVQSGANSGWISWRPRERQFDPGGITWKLYVSPRPEHVRDAFHALVRVLGEHGGAPMKIGQDAAGLLRPDKLVAYFASRAELDAVAGALTESLRGCPAHGVPFSAPIDARGVLSWGADPPDSERALKWLDRESWRLWVAKSLASALSIAKSARGTTMIAPRQFAIERVRRRGVDVATWAPTSTLWSDAA